MANKRPRRFTAKRATITKELVQVMTKMQSTSLLISNQNLMDEDDVIARITFDRNGRRYIAECNTWQHFLDNLRAAQLAIEYTWRITDGYGVDWQEGTSLDDLLDRVFGWLEAPLDPGILMIGDGDQAWFEVMSVQPEASGAAIKNAYVALANVHHPDNGGDKDDFIKLRAAYDEGMEIRG